MIAWWWIPVVLAVAWAGLLAVAMVRDPEVWDAVALSVLTVVSFPVLVFVWVLGLVDVGVVRLSPRALARFARARSVDRRPAYVFHVWKRGVIILRKWDVGDDIQSDQPIPGITAPKLGG